MADAAPACDGPALPVGYLGYNNVGWWGVLCLIATEASLFAYLLFSYFYFAVQFGRSWFPEAHPSLALAGPNTAILLCSSVAVWWGECGIKRGDRRRLMLGLVAAILLGAVFVGVQLMEWKAKTYGLATSSYGSLFFTVTGFHMAHVIVGLLVLAAMLLWSTLGYFTERRHAPILIASAYWHFVDVVWLFVFSSFYLSPYLW